MAKFRKGTEVRWRWGPHVACGKVVETFETRVTRILKGETVTRKASRDEPAYLIEQVDKAKVLKSESELEKNGD